MTEIAVDNDLSILIDERHWRLKRKYADGVLVLATPDGVRYSDGFADARRLPRGVTLKGGGDILRVVLGWEARDKAWHLGVIVSPALAEARRSRWCALASWRDVTGMAHQSIAQQSGEALATIIGADLHVIPVEKPIADEAIAQQTSDQADTVEDVTKIPSLYMEDTPTKPIPPGTLPVSAPVADAQRTSVDALDVEEVTDEAVPPPPLPALPLSLGDWRLVHEEGKLTFLRERRWRRQKYQQIAWNFFWALVYLVISALTLVSDLTLPSTGTLIPNPQILPYMGLVIGFGLVLMALYRVFSFGRQPQRIIVSRDGNHIEAWHGGRRLWACPVHDVLSVYVSEIVSKKTHDKTSEHGEINLHLGMGRFKFLLKQGDKLSNETMPDPPIAPERNQSGVVMLERQRMFTALQASGLYLAEAIGNVPTWYDMRTS